MANIQQSVSRAFAATRDSRIDYHIVEKGSASLITGIYDQVDPITQGFYRKPDITNNGETTKLAVTYGEVMITPYLIDAGVESSTNDPSSILKTYRFITGDGTNSGIVPGPNGSPLENIYIKDPNNPTKVPEPVVDSDGRPSLGNVVLASALGGLITSAPKIWDLITGSTPSTSKVGSTDPVTGKPILSADAKATAATAGKVSLGQLADVDESGKGQNYALVYDTEKLKWVSKSFNSLLDSAFGTNTVCGGEGGSGGSGGGASTGSSTTGTYYHTRTSNDRGGFGIPLVLSPVGITGASVGFYDGYGTSYTVASGITLGSLEGIEDTLELLFKSYLKVSIVAARCYYATGAKYVKLTISALNALDDSSVCQVQRDLNIWIKNSTGAYITSPDSSFAICAPCYVRNTDLKLENIKVASTENISASLSIISKTPAAPILQSQFYSYTAPTSPISESSTASYNNTNFTVTSAGTGVYRSLPILGTPKIHYRQYTVDTILSNGTYGTITSAVPNSNIKITSASSFAQCRWYNGVWNGSNYMVIGRDSSNIIKTMFSTDGIVWTQGATSFPFTAIPGDAFSVSVTWSGTKYHALFNSVSSTNCIASSTDGITWSSHTPASVSDMWKEISWNGSVFIVYGVNTGGYETDYMDALNVSSDGVTWSSATPLTSFYPDQIAVNGSTFCITGKTSGQPKCATSTNGTSWSTYNMPSLGTWSAPGVSYSTIATGNGLFVAVAGGTGSTTNAIVYSTNNGVSWISSAIGIGTYYTNSRIKYDGTYFHIIHSGTSSSLSTTINNTVTATITSTSTLFPASVSAYIPMMISNNAGRIVSFYTGLNATSPTSALAYTMPITSAVVAGVASWTIQKFISNDAEIVPYSYGYDPQTSIDYFEIPIQAKQLTISPITSIDGVSISVGDRILLKDQTNSTQNGIYEVISSTILESVYELSIPNYSANGVWSSVTAGIVNIGKDFMLNTSTNSVHLLQDPQIWNDVSDAPYCITTTNGSSGGGSPGSPGSPGDCTTVDTATKAQPTISLSNPCSKQYGTQTTPPGFDAITLPALTISTSIASTTATVNYTITSGNGDFSLSDPIPGTVASTFAERSLTLVGPQADIMTASVEVIFIPDNASKGEIQYTVTITNAEGTKAGTGCTIVPKDLVVANNQAATAKVCVSATSSGGTGKVKVTFNGKTIDLTSGFVAYTTSASATASAIASNINGNIAFQNALPVTDPEWLPNFTTSVNGTDVTVSAPAAGGEEFNGVTLTTEVTSGFVFGECSGTFLGGITKNISDFFKNNIPQWDKVSDVLYGIAGNVLGSVLLNMIMNDASQVQISLPSEEVSSVDIAFLYRGRIIKVPNEYNASARTGHPTYAGFSGVWKQQWTQNPAWCLYDFIINKRYGMGSDLQLTTSQENTLLKDIFAIGLYCDELVTNSDNTTQPRFSLNTVITEGTKLQILQQICSVFYGAYMFHNGGLRIAYDHFDTNIKLLVTQANASSFDKSLTSSKNFINKVRLSYVEPSNFYTEEIVVAENINAISTYGERTADIAAFGCTSAEQAKRYAKWILDSEVANSLNISYTGGLDHYNLVPGDLVEFYDSNERNIRRAGRIVSQSGANIVLDGNIASGVGDYFSLTLSDGTIHQTTILSKSGLNLVMASAPGVSASPNATFIAAKLSYGKKLYKVVKIDEVSNSKFSIALQYYNVSKFTSTVESSVPSVPANLRGVRRNSTQSYLKWDASTQSGGPGVAGYYVYRNGNTTTPYATVSTPSFTDSSLTASTVYTYQVAAYSADSIALISTPSELFRTFTRIGVYSAAGYNSQTIVTSTNGSSFTNRTLPGGANRNWQNVVSSKDTMVIFASALNKMAYSTAGTTWVEVTLPFTPVSYIDCSYSIDATSGAGQFIGMSYGESKGLYSVDGITWGQFTLPSSGNWTTPVFGNGVWLSMNINGSTAVTSSDGINWVLRYLPATSQWSTPSFGSGLFCLVGSNGNTVLTTIDGTSWIQGVLPSSTNWNYPRFADGKFVLTKNGSASGAYSADGINWTTMTLPSSSSWKTANYGNGKFLTIDATTGVAYSTDGITWTSATLPTSGTWRNPFYGDGIFLVLGTSSSNKLLTSTDGITWSTVTLPSTLNYRGPSYS